MRFADSSNCTYTELNSPHRYAFKGKCIMCGELKTVEIPGPELYRYRQGALIQDALKSVSSGDREFLMTGICAPCFDETFKEDEDDE